MPRAPGGYLKLFVFVCFFSRKALVKLGISSQKLLIETGRYDNIPCTAARNELYFTLFFLGPVQTSIGFHVCTQMT